jgi:hypothetical protein
MTLGDYLSNAVHMCVNFQGFHDFTAIFPGLCVVQLQAYILRCSEHVDGMTRRQTYLCEYVRALYVPLFDIERVLGHVETSINQAHGLFEVKHGRAVVFEIRPSVGRGIAWNFNHNVAFSDRISKGLMA